jgi:hypothetical protein
MNQMGFDHVARVEIGEEACSEFDEWRRRILIQGTVGGGEAVASAVARGMALAPSGGGSSGAGAVGAGGLDLF